MSYRMVSIVQLTILIFAISGVTSVNVKPFDPSDGDDLCSECSDNDLELVAAVRTFMADRTCPKCKCNPVPSSALKDPNLTMEKIEDKSYYISNEPASFPWSYRFCMRNGMRLLTLNTHEKLVAVTSYLSKKDKKYVPYWTSGVDFGQYGRFFWLTTGELMEDEDFAPWQEPGDGKTTRGLLVLINHETEPKIYNNKLYKQNAENTFRFVCEL